MSVFDPPLGALHVFTGRGRERRPGAGGWSRAGAGAGAGRWSPVPAILALLAALACGVLAGVVGRPRDGVVLVLLLAPLGAIAVVATAMLRERPLPLQRKFLLTGAIVVVVLLVALAVLLGVMFVSAQDALLAAVVIAYAGAVGGWSTQVMARRALTDLDELREGVRAVAEGARHLELSAVGAAELADLAREVERMARRLREEEQARAAADQARRNLVAAVSHDLRTPLTSLRLLAEAFEDDLVAVGAAERSGYPARMVGCVRTLSALVDDLFELSRLEGGALPGGIENVHLAELVEETIEAMRPAADAGAVDVTADLPGALSRPQANPEQLQRVLFNLLTNAIRHTPAEGRIVVSARDDPEGGVLIEVADTGDGIPPDDRERVFEPFVQAGARVARSDGGAGLGLAISRAIVEAHGGRIWVAGGDEEGGTRIRLRLPAARTVGVP